MPVKTSNLFNALSGDNADAILGELALYALRRILVVYVVDDFKTMPWLRRLSPRYKARKLKRGRPGIADLMLTGRLIGDIIGRAPNRIRVEGRSAKTSIRIAYAATHQYGDPSRNIPKREFIRFEAYRDRLAKDLKTDFVKIMRKVK